MPRRLGGRMLVASPMWRAAFVPLAVASIVVACSSGSSGGNDSDSGSDASQFTQGDGGQSASSSGAAMSASSSGATTSTSSSGVTTSSASSASSSGAAVTTSSSGGTTSASSSGSSSGGTTSASASSSGSSSGGTTSASSSGSSSGGTTSSSGGGSGGGTVARGTDAGGCLGSSLLSALGKNRLMIGVSGSSTAEAAAPYDLRYVYISGGLFSSSTPCASCSSCAPSGSWWGCYDSPPGMYATYFLEGAAAASPPQIPMFTYYELLQTAQATISGFQEGTAEATTAVTNSGLMTRYYNDWR